MLLSELEHAAVDPETGELEITQRQGQATVVWSKPYTVRNAIQAGQGKKGLYLIYRSGNIVDSGKAEKQDLASRLLQHFEYPLRHGENLNTYRIKLGIIRRVSAINLGEGTLTRSLVKKGIIPKMRRNLLTAQHTTVPNTAQFRAVGRGIRIRHGGAVPKELGLKKTKAGQVIQTIRPGMFEYPLSRFSPEVLLDRELGKVAAMLESSLAGEMENAPAQRWHFWDAWVWMDTAWSRVETLGPVMDTHANGEQRRITLLLKWQARSPGKQVMARCFSWNGSQWLDCRNHWF